MSMMRMTARITSKCPCGKKFEQDPALLLKGKMYLYCSDPCIAEFAPEYICQACGELNDPDKAAYGLPICRACQDIAVWSCWRKRSFRSSFDADRWIEIYAFTGIRRPLSPYRCELCLRWHTTSWSITKVASAEYKARVAAIAAVFRAASFDIDQARGYTNNPDGTHELNESYDDHSGYAAAERLLQTDRRRAA